MRLDVHKLKWAKEKLMFKETNSLVSNLTLAKVNPQQGYDFKKKRVLLGLEALLQNKYKKEKSWH